MSRILKRCGEVLLGLAFGLCTVVLFAAVGLLSVAGLAILWTVITSMAQTIASWDGFCGLMKDEAMYATCASSPWFVIVSIGLCAGTAAGLYLGWPVFMEFGFPAPAVTKPGEGSGRDAAKEGKGIQWPGA